MTLLQGKCTCASSQLIIRTLQSYLKEFANLFEEFKEKDVAIFGVCAEEQDQADRMERELSLPFKACQQQHNIQLVVIEVYVLIIAVLL